MILDGKCVRHLSLVPVWWEIKQICVDRCRLTMKKSEMKTMIDEIAKEHEK